MTEGIFPKVDGDYLYASEVNRFNNRGAFFWASGAKVSSGTSRQICGSFYFSGLDDNKAMINFLGLLDNNTESPAVQVCDMRLSGTAVGDTNFFPFASGQNLSFIGMNGHLSLAQGVNTFLVNTYTNTDEYNINPFRYSVSIAQAINPGSPFVLFFALTTNQGPKGYTFFNAQMNKSTIV